MNSSELRELKILRELLRRKAKVDLFSFVMFLKWDYHPVWHHKFICDKIDAFVKDPTKNKLMLFVPPQHGKTEIASRMLPPYLFGQNPDIKIAGTSYSIDLARSFNRDIQRYINKTEYNAVFPGVSMSADHTTSEEFDIKDSKGSYKSIGIMGGLSGRTVDFAIIDDPVKDAMEANSSTYRDRVWDWYLNVLQTRLHNKSKVILIMTRWHSDDLAGRLLNYQADKWEVISIPAIMNGDSVPEDPREPGEPLWPDRHSLSKLLELKSLSEATFSSLYQQNPIIEGGNKIKAEWFEYCEEDETPKDITWDCWIDGAYTKSTKNDPSGLMIAGYSGKTKKVYIKHAIDKYMEMPELLQFTKDYVNTHKLTNRSKVLIEPKASGKSLAQMLFSQTKLNIIEIKSKLVSEGKEARCQMAATRIEASRMVLVRGNWNEAFVFQLTGYPKAPHDEFIDLAGYAAERYFKRKSVTVHRPW